MRIEYHRTLIADTVRNTAFYAALKALIVPGKSVVCDIGAGTGLLGIMASKLGAKAVYMFETAEVSRVAARIIKANRIRNCHLIPCHSTEFDDVLQADIIVSETLGNYALEENIVDTLNDARRFLVPGGEIIPCGVSQHVAPVVSPRIDNELRAWQRMGKTGLPAIDLGIAQVMSFNNAYVRTLAPKELLDQGRSAAVWDTIDFTRAVASSRRGEARWSVGSQQIIYGFASWWSARLAPQIALSTGPSAPQTHWEQLYFPLLEPVHLQTGQAVALTLKSRSSEAAGTHLSWVAAHFDARGKQLTRQAHDLDKGFLP